MLGSEQDHVALLGANHVRDFTSLQREDLVVQFLGHGAALEITEVAAIFCRGSVGVFLRQVFKFRALVNLVEQILGFGLGGCERRIGLGLRRRFGFPVRAERFRGQFGRDENFTEANLLGPFHLRAVLFVELLLVLFVDGQLLSDLLANHALGDDLVAQVLLEVLIGSALCFGRFFQIFHSLKVHLLAHFIEALDQFGVAGDAQVFGFLQQKLLVNEVAQNIFLSFGKQAIGVGGVLLLNFLLELIAAADVFRAGHDFVVHPGDDLFNHGIGGRKSWK